MTAQGPSSDGFDPSFDAVFEAARSGDRLAFDQIWYRLSGRVLGFARAQGASDPEGIVNETPASPISAPQVRGSTRANKWTGSSRLGSIGAASTSNAEHEPTAVLSGAPFDAAFR